MQFVFLLQVADKTATDAATRYVFGSGTGTSTCKSNSTVQRFYLLAQTQNKLM